MQLTDILFCPPHVMVRYLDGETVLLDLDKGTYFSLDAVGTRIWQLMSEGRALAEVCAAMLDEYEVSREQIERDVLELAGQLEMQGLIQLQSPSA